jgi:hypothetical protein
MADSNEMDEMTKMNQEYVKRLRSGSPIAMPPSQAAPTPPPVPPPELTEGQRYDKSLRGRISNAMTKYLGPKDPLADN